MNTRIARITTRLLISLLCLLTITGSVRPNTVEKIRSQGEIVVITRNSPTTYFEDNIGATGYEFELAKAFADYLGVNLVIKQADSLSEIYNAIDRNDAAFAAAGLTATQQQDKWVRFSTPYMQVSQQVIYRRGGMKPKEIFDLAKGQLVVTSDSSHAHQLRKIQGQQIPELTWSESPDFETVELLQMVATGEVDFTVIDSNEFEMLQAYYPNLAIAFDLTGAQPLAWAFPQSRDDSLFKVAQSFFRNAQTNGLLLEVRERFYGHLDQLNYVGAKRFQRQSDKKLSKYDGLFQQAAKRHNLDWRLLAAMSYQESHWNPRAKSFTGVRGMMMLTRRTAKELGVRNRLDPKQSIDGGADYLVKLRKRLPKSINEPDRTWMALAAYNVGYGHLTDARKLAKKDGGDNTRWMDVKNYLPLLSQKRYYKQTRHGYARGSEPVSYVQNIRRYFDVLVWNDNPDLDIALESENLQLSASIRVIPPLL
ncbi:MAG: membrane-bound lytic murein transglycosylase MltF [Oleispira antarctica]|uniref:Membrane-bound lytic murein transglycosylase F n=1 Tax=Oleispira antarctica RB-8 TaxID=698738 RepID=R4YUD2_OLEAN|nr:membrane-bound lytic murein transglycosylase MltF [Oleispira antarctica]MBQ0792049.1 membrane-bound lytic murein transglycosylase MltF [Oleispira antarctica]CCK76559.1 Predicted soluble lytic transglycosylase [Oleispira antarctica RB-8]|tara:strand:- start:2667 stop:4103 length:1437 start_codon:yes stop_codon:yes gene_type:complete